MVDRRPRIPAECGQDRPQERRYLGAVRSLDQHDGYRRPLGRGILGPQVASVEATRDRRLAVVAGADNQEIVGPHPAFRLQDALKPFMRVDRPPVSNPKVTIYRGDPLVGPKRQEALRRGVEVISRFGLHQRRSTSTNGVTVVVVQGRGVLLATSGAASAGGETDVAEARACRA